jgi:hypothetical protein
MYPYINILFVFVIVLLLKPTKHFSQTHTRRQLTGLYSAQLGGGTWHEPSIIPAKYFKLKVRFWGRFVLKERQENVSYRNRFWFIKSRPKKWGRYSGRWKHDGDSLIMKFKYNNGDGRRQAFYIQFWGDYKVLGVWKIYRMRLTSRNLSLLKVWRGDDM